MEDSLISLKSRYGGLIIQLLMLSGSQECQKETGILKYDFDSAYAPDELRRPFQFPRKSDSKTGSDKLNTGQPSLKIKNCILVEH